MPQLIFTLLTFHAVNHLSFLCIHAFCLFLFFNFKYINCTISATEEVNEMLSSSVGYREIKTMGWLSEQVHLGGDSSRMDWKPVFMALTEKDMLLYEAAPWSKEDWSAPYLSHPLLATR